MYLGGAAARLRARDSRALSGAAGSSCPCDKDSARTPLACGLQATPNACTSVQCWQGSDTLTASSITTCRPDPEQAGNNTHPVLDNKSWATTWPLGLQLTRCTAPVVPGHPPDAQGQQLQAAQPSAPCSSHSPVGRYVCKCEPQVATSLPGLMLPRTQHARIQTASGTADSLQRRPPHKQPSPRGATAGAQPSHAAGRQAPDAVARR